MQERVSKDLKCVKRFHAYSHLITYIILMRIMIDSLSASASQTQPQHTHRINAREEDGESQHERQEGEE